MPPKIKASAADLTVAAIDVGSNASRLAIARVSTTGLMLDSATERYPVRLGADVFAHGAVSAAKMRALIKVFADMRDHLAAHGVRTYRAVATSAMRDASNGQQLARQIFEETGISLQIITGAQESKLSRAALLRSVGSAEPSTLLMDLGGGSLELERASDASRRGRSLPIGSVRLLEAFPQMSSALAPPQLRALRAEVKNLLREHLRAPKPALTVLGTGGILDALATLLPVPDARVPMVELGQLEDFATRVAEQTVAERQRAYNLRPDRADLLLPATLIVLELVDLFRIERLVVPGTGLRDALLYNLLVPSEPGAPVRRLLGQANDTASTADKGARLARELFMDLGAAHQLYPPAMQPMLTALYAWYFGALLQPKDAVKHAQYVLQHVDNPYLDARSQAVALYAVAAQDLAPEADMPARQALWRSFAPAQPGDGQVAQILAGMVRIAIAMAPQGRRTSAIDIDTLHDPIVVSADLSAPLSPATLQPLAAALGRAIVVR